MRGVFVALAMAMLGALTARADQCPYKFNAIPLSQGQSLSCSCGPVDGSGMIYGTDTYTADSYSCAAALHAGAVKPSGGDVTFHVGPGCQRYDATERNGVASAGYGAYSPSIAFTDPMPLCADVVEGERLTTRFRSECRASGRSPAYCECAIDVVGRELGSFVSVYYTITDSLTSGAAAPEMRDALVKKLVDAGIGVVTGGKFVGGLDGLKTAALDVRKKLEACHD